MADARPRSCANCGYDLHGLPGTQGTCPECGQYWNAVSGEGMGDRLSNRRRQAEHRLERGRTLALAGLAVLVMAGGAVGSLYAVTPMRPVALAGLIAAVLALSAVTSYFYEDRS